MFVYMYTVSWVQIGYKYNVWRAYFWGRKCVSLLCS